MNDYSYKAISFVAQDVSERLKSAHGDNPYISVDEGRACSGRLLYTVCLSDAEGVSGDILFEGTLLETFDYLWDMLERL